jgi:uncharacterized protein (DUF362 family)
MSKVGPTTLRLFDPRVGVFDTGQFCYPERPPFNPPERYPEYPFAHHETDPKNYVYGSVRQLFLILGLDVEHYGSPEWNPLGKIIRPGDNIVLKPNLVISDHPDGLTGIQAAVVHGSILRPFIDYAFIANKGRGRITVADSPIKEVEFYRVLELTGIRPTIEYVNEKYGLEIELIDFRDLQVRRNKDGVMISSQQLTGDPGGYRVIDLAQRSMLLEISQYADLYRSTAAVYENAILRAHNQDRNLYSIPSRILEANVVISLAKLKTHRKAGVTLSLKNMVGITNEKRWLPHHRIGSPAQGGDLYSDSTRPDVKLKELAKDLLITHSWGQWGARHVGLPLFNIYKRFAKPLLDRIYRNGSMSHVEDGDWFGNDTVWRMVLDLNTLLFYASPDGHLLDVPQRRYFSLIDGIIGGMEEGPLKPRPHPAGLLIAGFNPVAVDIVCTRLMGFDYQKIPKVQRAAERDWLPLGHYRPNDLIIESNTLRWREIFRSRDPGLGFTPSVGWRGHIEIDSD